MAKQIDYQVLLETAVTTTIKAAGKARQEGNGELLFAYYDVLDAIKTQAEVMEVPLSEIGLEDVDLDEYLKDTVALSKQQAA